MADTAFKHGSPLMVDYTPGSAVALGEVVVIGSRAYIAHNAITASIKGAVAAGGGVYTLTAAKALTDSEEVYWDDTAKKVTDVASGNLKFGCLLPGVTAAADGDSVDVLHYLGAHDLGS